MTYILGIDQGTTGSTAVLLNEKGKRVASCNIPFRQHFPQPGWVEHQPEEIWSSVGRAVKGALSQGKIKATSIACIGMTNQRETVSLFKNGRALHPFIVWQDRRTSEDCKKLKSQERIIRTRNGTPIDPYFSSTKIAYLYRKLKLSKKDSAIRFRTIDSFLFERMTGADVIEATNAHRTQLLNLHSAQWDPQLFNIFDIPKSSHPELIPSEGMQIKTKKLEFLPAGIPIQACLGDQQAALFGQSGWKAGDGKITYGTGAFILLNTGTSPVVSKNKLVSTLALQWKNGNRSYALEGSVFICGAWVQWLRDQLQILKTSAQIEELAMKVSDSAGLIVIPALSGMGAPFWKADVRAAILGLTRGSNRSHLARASLEALAFQNRALIDAFKKDFSQSKSRDKKMKLRVDGGAANNNFLMQIQSDVLNQKLYRPKNLEATATGVALLAAHANGIMSLKEIENSWVKDRIFQPKASEVRSLDSKYKIWLNAVQNLEPLTSQ